MNQTEINRLIYLYQVNELDQDDWRALEQAIEQNWIQPDELEDLRQLSSQIDQLIPANTPTYVKQNITELIEAEKTLVKKSKQTGRSELYIRYALTAAAMMTGIILGWVIPGINKPKPANDLVLLKQEVHDLRETMMLNLLKNDGVSDRLKAVSYTETLDQYSKTVIEALVNTLNTDDNINVRLAAVEALQNYGQVGSVREQLVKSIGKQESPLVQMALAECMVMLKEKTSIQELEKIISNKETPAPVKKRLEGYIKQI